MNREITLTFSEDYRKLGQMYAGGRQLLASQQNPLFTLGLRDQSGKPITLTSMDAETVSALCQETKKETVITYTQFPCDLTVEVVCKVDVRVTWRIRVENRTENAVEYVEFPAITYTGKMRDNGGDASVLWPYNEGVLLTNSTRKPQMIEPKFPSEGNFAMFPYMVFAQFTLYMFGNAGIYMGIHDSKRGVKDIDFFCKDEDTYFRTRLYMGGQYGESVATDYDVVWELFDGVWQDGAALYREWFQNNLPDGLKKVSESEELPGWYRDDMPLVLAYPVRGKHDTDIMNPNRLFPYMNAMPHVERFASETDSTVMALLMHWEGTAPWAPPYTWPPYGGEEPFREFMDALHEKGHLMGVYCSGYGYTEQSHLIESYNMREEIDRRNLESCFTRSPEQELLPSRICTGIRKGYDICAASETGRAILDEALEPLLKSGVDYVQALDQNHGGGQYFCYSKNHGHPPVPGNWITEASSDILKNWNKLAPNTLLGCESAAAEPYVPYLRLSDNRYELDFPYGHPQPVYAFIYHEYLHNFMGNQVCCPVGISADGLTMRMAYSYLAGDLVTLVINELGEICYCWTTQDSTITPVQGPIIKFVAALQKWHKIYAPLFRDGRMITPLPYSCEEVMHKAVYECDLDHYEKAVMSTAWQTEGKNVQLFVNYTEEAYPCTVEIPGSAVLRISETDCRPLTEKTFTVAPHSVVAIEW